MQRVGLVGVELLDLLAGERGEHFRVQLGRRAHEPCPSGSFAGLTHEPSVLAPRVQHGGPGLDSAVLGHELEIVEAMSSLIAERWAKARSFHHSLYSPARIAAERDCAVSVCLPARECAGTVGEIVAALGELRDAGAIDEIVVVDAASQDGTADVARRAGATVWQEAELMPAYGPVLGKGDAMWRALSVLSGELVMLPGRRHRGLLRAFRHGRARPARLRAGGVVREGLLSPAARGGLR